MFCRLLRYKYLSQEVTNLHIKSWLDSLPRESEVTNLANEVTNLSTNVPNLANEVTNIGIEVTNLASEVTDLAIEVANITNLANDIKNLASEVTNLSIHVMNLKFNGTFDIKAGIFNYISRGIVLIPDFFFALNFEQ